MIRFVWAFARLRWRLMLNGLKASHRRDAVERFSRGLTLVLLVLVAITVALCAAGLGVLALVGGYLLGSGQLYPAIPMITARGLLLLVMAMLLLFPLGGATHGGVTRNRRLLLLPIPRRTLHAVEALAGLADPWVAFVLPGLLLFAVGLLAAGRPGLALLALAAGLALIALFAALGSLVAFLLSWLLRSRKRGELFTLLFVVALSVVGVMPAFLSTTIGRGARVRTPAAQREPGTVLERLDRKLPLWSRALPSELYGRSLAAGVARRNGAAWLGVAVLLVEAAALYGLSATVHRRLLDAGDSGSARRRGAARVSDGRRLPGLTREASAVALAQLRTALRSVRGRLVVALPGPLVALLGLLCRRTPDEFPGGALLGTQGHVVLGAGIVFGLYALLAFSMNQFAADRGGLTLQLLAPISERDLVRGKAAGCAMVYGLTVLFCLAAALIVAPGGPPLAWVAVLLAGAATYLLLTPVAALLSAVFPIASDLSKTGSGGNPHSLAMLFGTLLILVLSAPAVGILAIAGHVLGRYGLAVVLLLLWTMLAAAIAIPTLELAARAVSPRRENLALVAQGR